MSRFEDAKTADGAQMGEIAIRLTGVAKSYRLFSTRTGFLREALLGRQTGSVKPVLKGITLDIRRGERVGIIGRNGAGKSTLLKMIAGTLPPTEGAINVNGRISAILELGTGFNPAYSGRDNVVMSALMRGMTEEEIRGKIPQIAAFSGLESVLDEPFQTYSSGMQARLAFAAAVAVEADIIIIDEALAAGDARFTARSLRRIREICESGVTALFVSHQTYHVMQLCSRAVWIDNGGIRMDGPPLEVCRAYEYEMHDAIARDEGRKAAEWIATRQLQASESAKAETVERQVGVCAAAPEVTEDGNKRQPAAETDAGSHAAGPAPSSAADQMPKHFSTGQFKITSVEFLDEHGAASNTFRFGTPMAVRVAYECLLPQIPDSSCGLAVGVVSSPDHQAVMYMNTNYPHSDDELLDYYDRPFRKHRGRTGVIEGRIPAVQLKPGNYIVSLGILPNRPEAHEFYEYHHLAYAIAVTPNGFPEPSVFYANVDWKHGPADEKAAAGRRISAMTGSAC